MIPRSWFALVTILVLISPLLAAAAPAEVRILAESSAGLQLEVDFSTLARESVEVDGEVFERLYLPGGGHHGAAGQPALPTFTQLVALPVGSGVQVQINAVRDHDLGAMKLAPVQPIVEHDRAAPDFDAEWYASAAVAQPSVSLGEPALLHGLRVVPVTFSPVGYDPDSGAVRAAQSMTVEIVFSGHDDRATPPKNQRLIPESFAALYERNVIGWERDGSVATGPGSVIYICRDYAAVTDIIDELAQWRREQGYHTEVVTTATTGTTANAIRSWLITRYAELDPPLEFVTLVGDASGTLSIPTFYEGYSGLHGEGDHDYARLDGQDVFADVHVGRLSCQSTTELQRMVDKILGYEREPDLSDTDWFTTAGLTGDPYDSGYSCIFVNQFFKQQLIGLGYTQVDTIWTGNFTSLMMATINQGETIFTYRGLGGMSGMGVGHIQSLTNGRQLPFAIILTCDTGSFADDTTCRSEAFLRAVSGGGIACIGTATNGTHTRYNNCMFLGITDHMTESGEFRLGPALNGGKFNMYRNYWQNEASKVWIWSTWNNLMGDPATELRTGVPVDLEVEHLANVAVSANALPVTVSSGGAPLERARVAVYQAGQVHDFAYTDAFGQAVLDIAGAAAGDLRVTVTGHDLYPYRGVAAVGTVDRSLDLADFDVDGDGVATPGETVQISLALTNGGSNAATGVTASLAATADWITASEEAVAFATVPAGGTVWGQSAWTVALAAAAPGGTPAVLELHASSGGETWTSLLSLPVSGPRVIERGINWGMPDGTPDPGEVGTLSLNLNNVGNLPAAAFSGQLSCNSVWVDVTDPDGSWGAMSVGESGLQLDTFGLSIEEYCHPGHLASFILELTFAEGGSQSVEFSAVIGTASVGDPSGPDTYGYYAFDNGDDHPSAPTYDWLELAGLGSDIGIDDVARWDDETRVVDLPFPFTYYGQSYDTISVCSNGWLAFGVTSLKYYRNWSLPAAGSPDAMACAFWDDLANGTVYTYHDEANHRFIVQWDAFETYYDGYPIGYYNGNCTFQIILTDPAYSETDTGDGLITMQYQAVTISSDETGYFTTGIQDHTREVGLTYVYGNDYAGGGAAVTANRAITFRPVTPQIQGTLQGVVRNGSAHGAPIANAIVEVIGANRQFATQVNGSYSGSVPVGNWTVAVSHASCAPDTIDGVDIAEDLTTTLDFTILDIVGPAITGTTQLPATSDTEGPYVVEATITDLSGAAESALYYTSSSSGGPFTVPLELVDADLDLMRGFIPGQALDSRVQYWLGATDIVGNDSRDPFDAPWNNYSFVVSQQSGEIDVSDMESNGEWSVGAGDDSADTGLWVRVNPNGVYDGAVMIQPEDDHTPAPGTQCWITGNDPPGSNQGTLDVDGGKTTLLSPIFDLSDYNSVEVEYYRWYSNNTGSSPGEDAWQVAVNDGDGWVALEHTQETEQSWLLRSFALDNYVAMTSMVQFRFVAEDAGGGSVVEAGVDDFALLGFQLPPDQAAPTVNVRAPNGGENLQIGTEALVTWNGSDDIGIVEATLLLSIDGGASYPHLIAQGPYNGTLSWLVPALASPTCRVKVICRDALQNEGSDVSDADFAIGGTVDVDTPAVKRLALAQNVPNPFNPRTEIRYELPEEQVVQLRIYNVEGKLVRTLLDGRQPAGRHSIVWSGENDQGARVASGLYFYRLSAGAGELTRKMLLLK